MTVKRVPPLDWEDPSSEGSETRPVGSTTPQTTSRVSLAAEDDIIPIAYGSVEIAGKLAIVKSDGNHLAVLVIWCVGEIEEITTVLFNDSPMPGSVVHHAYTGTPSQGVNSYLAGLISGYEDTLVYHTPDNMRVGIAYSVLRIPPDVTTGFPRIKARIKGRKVPVTVGDPFKFSRNPASILVDLILDPIIGLGRPVDGDSFLALAADCDEVMADGRPRRELSLVLDRQQSVERWVETLRAYASCTVGVEAGRVKVMPLWVEAAPEDIVEVTADDIMKGSFSVNYRQEGKPATVVTVSYIDQQTVPFTTNEARHIPQEVLDKVHPWRDQTVSMPGIMTRSQAMRESVERLLAIWLAPLTVTWRAFDEGLKFSVGDRVNITHPIGLDSRPFRITRVDASSPGRWNVTAEEFNAGIRSDITVDDDEPSRVQPIAPPGGGEDSDPITAAPVEFLTLSEVISADNLQPPQSQIQARWQPAVSPILTGYEVQYSSEAGIWSALDQVSVEEWLSILLPTPVVYQVRVRALGEGGLTGPWALQSILLQGKQYNLDVPTSLQTSGGGDCFNSGALPFSIRINWTFPVGAGTIAHTELWYNTAPLVTGATLYGTYPYPLREMTVSGLRTGEKFYIFARFVDTNGNFGPWRDTNGTLGVTSCSADVIMEYITGDILKSDLHQTLVNEIDTKLGPNDPPIIQINQKISGLQGQYTVKIQSGRYVAGYGLAVDPTDKIKSRFIVRADQFAVGHPSVPDKYPFIIQNGTVYIARTAIGDAWIQNAHIDNLAVNNAKIGWNAVTETVVVSANGKSIEGGANLVGDIYLNLWESYGIAVIAQAQLSVKARNAETIYANFSVHQDGQPWWNTTRRYVTSTGAAYSTEYVDMTAIKGWVFGVNKIGTIPIRFGASISTGRSGADPRLVNFTATILIMKK